MNGATANLWFEKGVTAKPKRLRKMLRIAAWSIGGIVVIPLTLAAVLLTYLSLRPAGRTLRPVSSVSVPVRFKPVVPFIDYMTVSGQQLYAGYTTRGLVSVMNMGSSRVVASVEGGLINPHGIAVDGARGLGFVTDSGDDTVAIFNLKTNQLLQKIGVADDPDAILFDERAQLVYVGSHDGMGGTLVDPKSRRVAGAVALGGKAEFAASDSATGLIYQNLEDTNEVVVIDPQAPAIVKRFRLKGCENPTGLALDAANHRIFVSCVSRMLEVLDSGTGRVVADLPIGGLTDGVGYDPELKRVYASSAFGSVTVVQQDSPDRYRVLERAPTPLGSHSLAVDPVTHRVYFAYFGSIAVYEAVAQP